ncbi:hypothetical protein SLEP1_g30804 [Rubroshorea leprosula]|uniref:Uncharacterized protein n=1 Tax=Rubroshorea leprosula TaxID=152421 RepID=A0AAV5K9C5_9ROSI|nr:hypothetical protein SLEP1_g30804 [Rubroshorea leprosula]
MPEWNTHRRRYPLKAELSFRLPQTLDFHAIVILPPPT